DDDSDDPLLRGARLAGRAERAGEGKAPQLRGRGRRAPPRADPPARAARRVARGAEADRRGRGRARRVAPRVARRRRRRPSCRDPARGAEPRRDAARARARAPARAREPRAGARREAPQDQGAAEGGADLTSRIRERLAQQPPGYRFTIGRILAMYAGLMVTLLLAALDQTIVSTALPRIVSDLGGLPSYSWVFTAYLLATTVTVPLYGKLGDVYGRRTLIIVAIGLFLAGSALCGLSWGMPELIVFRAIQGFGAGGLFPLSLAVVGSMIPPRDRGRYQGLIGGVFAAASTPGPAVGRLLVRNASWR